MQSNLRNYVQKITKLPTIPAVAAEILTIIDNEKTDVKELAKIVKNDPALSAKVLSLANSAFFGGSHVLTGLDQAIVRIGLQNTRNIVLGVSLLTSMGGTGGKKTAADYERLFQHSFTVGAVAQYMTTAAVAGMEHLSPFLGGILHDIGLLVLTSQFPAEYHQIIQTVATGVPLLAAEDEVIGFSHADIGAWLAAKWRLPAKVCAVIEHHHRPMAAAADDLALVALIHAADILVSRHLLPPVAGDPAFAPDHDALSLLGLEEDGLQRLAGEIDQNGVLDNLLVP